MTQHLPVKRRNSEPTLLRLEHPVLSLLSPNGSMRTPASAASFHQTPARDGSTSPDTGSAHSRTSQDGGFQGQANVDGRDQQQRRSGTVLNSAWVSAEDVGGYRHRVTGAIYRNNGKIPQEPGPTANDIPDGWEAFLSDESKETWKYKHHTTGVVIDSPPTSLPAAVTREIDVAASHGKMPKYCQAFIENGLVGYKVTHPAVSYAAGWRTFRHPKLVEDDMKAFLANYGVNPSRPAKATFITAAGHHLPVNLDAGTFSGESGILLVEDIDQACIKFLCATFSDRKFMPHLILGHLLFDQQHQSEAEKKLADQVKGLYWMSLDDQFFWYNAHHDVFQDGEAGKLHFGVHQHSVRDRTLFDDLEIIRLSTMNTAFDSG